MWYIDGAPSRKGPFAGSLAGFHYQSLHQRRCEAGLLPGDFVDLIHADDREVVIRSNAFPDVGGKATRNLKWAGMVLKGVGLQLNVTKTANMVRDPGNLTMRILWRTGR